MIMIYLSSRHRTKGARATWSNSNMFPRKRVTRSNAIERINTEDHTREGEERGEEREGKRERGRRKVFSFDDCFRPN